MLPVELVVVLVLGITEAVKQVLKRRLKVEDLDPLVAPAIAVLCGALLNILNAALFADPLTVALLREAARQGILAAAAAAGLWAAGTNNVKRRLGFREPT